MNANALPDDPDWCGHPFVSLRTWTCADCERPVTPATRARLETAPIPAPPGHVWALLRGTPIADDTDDQPLHLIGVFSDRARIGRRLIQEQWVGAVTIRSAVRRAHWYQGVFNVGVIEGYDEEPDERGNCYAYRLDLERIDL